MTLKRTAKTTLLSHAIILSVILLRVVIPSVLIGCYDTQSFRITTFYSETSGANVIKLFTAVSYEFS